MKLNPITAIDFYKTDHRRQYPEGTTEIYSNFTPRSSRVSSDLDSSYDKNIVVFGLQYFLKDFLINSWNEQFFKKEKSEVINFYKRRMDSSLGMGAIDTKHLEDLHDLGYLPIRIKAMPEGSSVPIGVPILTIVNTHPKFFWLTNYLESVMSCYLWKPMTSATTAFEYKKLFTEYAIKTGSPIEFTKFQAHDFSFRGMSSAQDSVLNGAAHLTSFLGTDSVAGIDLLEDYYDADSEKELVGTSVPATEHSVMCVGTEEGELETFRRLINVLYPTGIISIVSDSWDFWRVITEYMVVLKDEILNRNGKVVIRPDSGDPIKIITGDPSAPQGSPEYKGAVECLWDIFGGTTTDQNYKMLNPHIGVIYGDSITLERAKKILEILEKKGFCSANIVFGVGSYTYQYVTRDTYGFAMKATSGVVNGKRIEIFKNPKTDSGTKKSAKGLLRVEYNNDVRVLKDQQSEDQEKGGELQTIFEDSKLIKEVSLSEIRQKLELQLNKIFHNGK